MLAPLEHLNLHVREGAILPTQVSAHPSPPWGLSTTCVSPSASQLPDLHPGCLQAYNTRVFQPQKPGTTSEATRGNPLRLIVTLSQSATAWGDLFWDDGESLDTFERGSYSYLVFNVTQVRHSGRGWRVLWHQLTLSSCHPLLQNIFTSTVLHASTEATEVTIGTLSIFGVRDPPSKVLLNGQEKPFSYLDNQVWPHLGVPCPGGPHAGGLHPSYPSPWHRVGG